MTDKGIYDPQSKSKFSVNTENKFLDGTISGIITEVPGIGPASASKLAADEVESEKVSNTWQLIAKFLSLKPDTNGDPEMVEHVQKFAYWLQKKGIITYRNGITRSIAMYANSMFPGMYDDSVYEGFEDAEDVEAKA